MREEWEEPWAKTGLRPSIMSPSVLGSVDFANCKHFGRGRGRARVSYRFSQDELAVLEPVRPKGEQRVVGCQMDRHGQMTRERRTQARLHLLNQGHAGLGKVEARVRIQHPPPHTHTHTPSGKCWGPSGRLWIEKIM